MQYEFLLFLLVAFIFGGLLGISAVIYFGSVAAAAAVRIVREQITAADVLRQAEALKVAVEPGTSAAVLLPVPAAVENAGDLMQAVQRPKKACSACFFVREKMAFLTSKLKRGHTHSPRP